MTIVPTQVAAPSAKSHRIARLTILALAGLSSFVCACVRDRDRAPAPSAASDAASPAAASTAPTPSPVSTVSEPSAPAQTPAPKPEPGTSTACNSDADCRTFSDGCGICSCRPFAKSSADPKCPGPRTTCIIDPCTGLRAICRKGNCMIGDPGDAAPPTPATKVADAAPSSAAPKVVDAAQRD